MKFYIYNKANCPTEVITKDKEIDYIHIVVISGDEVIKVVYTDGDEDWFDSEEPNWRLYEGRYMIYPEELDKWKNYKYIEQASYERLELFT